MIITVCQVDLCLPGSRSLKDKRMLVMPIIDRLRRRFNVSIAEVDGQDTWQRSVIGIAMINTSKVHAGAAVNRIIRMIEQSDVELLDYKVEHM